MPKILNILVCVILEAFLKFFVFFTVFFVAVVHICPSDRSFLDLLQKHLDIEIGCQKCKVTVEQKGPTFALNQIDCVNPGSIHGLPSFKSTTSRSQIPNHNSKRQTILPNRFQTLSPHNIHIAKSAMTGTVCFLSLIPNYPSTCNETLRSSDPQLRTCWSECCRADS